eukprot:CAMPEP_0176423594 /NCGR_PEP_ID=MMETSP0127-20121128/10368_1 /TAXON_ID=938130 /ORGANISM="Platyophrya macrostoma, Strain WH" /LENGTH=341 /DNA_ID=CAMNT_0017804557 /DNA_START=21 /DNA_END=1046 /DNA_ORIENTATION=-
MDSQPTTNYSPEMNLYQAPYDNKKLLVLDLDETLVHCRMEAFETATTLVSVQIEGCFVTVHIAKRPGVKAFLKEMSKYYTIALYTSSLKEYAEAVLKTLRIKDYFTYVCHREQCINSRGKKAEKMLSIFNRPPQDIILIDDSAVHVENQPYNILIVKKFQGQVKDKELQRITPFLKALANVPDVRPVSENFIQFKREAKAKAKADSTADTSILTKGLGDKAPKKKLIQVLNTQFKQKPRSPKKVVDKSNFENTDEGIAQLNLAQRMSFRNQKRLLFDMLRGQSPVKKSAKGGGYSDDGSNKPVKIETVECLEYNIETDDFTEVDLQPAQEYESIPTASFPQ